MTDCAFTHAERCRHDRDLLDRAMPGPDDGADVVAAQDRAHQRATHIANAWADLAEQHRGEQP